MTREEAVLRARREIDERTWDETARLLAAFEATAEDLTLAHVDFESVPGNALVYFRISGHSYFLGFLVVPREGAEVQGVFIAARVHVILTIQSETLTPGEIQAAIRVEPTRSYDPATAARLRPGKRRNVYEWSFEPHGNLPGDVEWKMGALLDAVADAAPRIAALADRCWIGVTVAFYGWAGDAQLGGWMLSTRHIEQLHALKAELDFDLYALGPVPAASE